MKLNDDVSASMRVRSCGSQLWGGQYVLACHDRDDALRVVYHWRTGDIQWIPGKNKDACDSNNMIT